MLVNGNRHFLNEACRLLKRANATTCSEVVAYNKLLYWVKQTKIQAVDDYIMLNRIEYLTIQT